MFSNVGELLKKVSSGANGTLLLLLLLAACCSLYVRRITDFALQRVHTVVRTTRPARHDVVRSVSSGVIEPSVFFCVYVVMYTAVNT